MADNTFVSGDHLGRTAQQREEADSRPEQKAVSAMTRSELEAYASELEIENPDNKDTFPNVESLRDAIRDVEDNA